MESTWNDPAEHHEAIERTQPEHAQNNEDVEGIPKELAANDVASPITNEKKRKALNVKESSLPSEFPCPNKKTCKSRPVDRTTNCSKKKMRLELESIHANSQQILRETKKTSFTAEIAVQRPVSSIIEKIRQRKIQLAPKVARFSAGASCPVKDVEIVGCEGSGRSADGAADGTEIAVDKSTSQLAVNECSNTDDVRDELNNIDPSIAAGPREELDDDSGGETLQTSKDLHPDSKTKSPSRSHVSIASDEDAVLTERSRIRLHLDIETHDDDSSRILEDRGERRKESPDPPNEELWFSVGQLRQLVDDEAEDEDEDDGPADDEDDDGDGTDDLHDLLGEDTGESEADREHRSNLHSKWLEQQDVAVEDSILNRLENGWKMKGRGLPAVLDDTREAPVAGKAMPKSSDRRRRVGQLLSAGSSKSPEDSSEKVKDFDLRVETNGSQGESGLFEQADIEAPPSDDEEAEGKLRRQLILEESEEQAEFLSVTDDDSSKEILTLINKVNVTTVKARSNTAHPDARTAGTSHSHLSLLQHQSSFLRRKVTTAVTTRQGFGVSRSYIFGRDDSNSRDSNRINDKTTVLQAEKENSCQSADGNVTSASHRGQKRSTNVAKHFTQNGVNPFAPSLFQILKQQAAKLDSSNATANLKNSRTTATELASFLAVRPPKRPTSCRGK